MELQNKINKILDEVRAYIDNKFNELENCELNNYEIKLNGNDWLIEIDYDQDGEEMDIFSCEVANIEDLFEKLKEDL